MKRSSILIFCLAAVISIVLGCGTAQTPTPAPADTRAQDEVDIRAAGQSWATAIDAQNLDQTLSYYADEAWVYPQNAPIAKTAEERRKVWADFFAIPGASDTQGEIVRVEVARSGDLAVEFGTFSMTTKDKKGKPMTQKEKYVVTWKKQPDGKWKVIADMWNTDK
jgi:ketosteroid isomerase-like protein